MQGGEQQSAKKVVASQNHRQVSGFMHQNMDCGSTLARQDQFGLLPVSSALTLLSKFRYNAMRRLSHRFFLEEKRGSLNLTTNR